MSRAHSSSSSSSSYDDRLPSWVYEQWPSHGKIWDAWHEANPMCNRKWFRLVQWIKKHPCHVTHTTTETLNLGGSTSGDLRDTKLNECHLTPPNCIHLDLSDNMLKDDIQSFIMIKLQTLDVSYNLLTRIPVIRYDTIRVLNVSHNDIIEVSDLTYCPRLVHFNCSFNKIKTFPSLPITCDILYYENPIYRQHLTLLKINEIPSSWSYGKICEHLACIQQIPIPALLPTQPSLKPIQDKLESLSNMVNVHINETNRDKKENKDLAQLVNQKIDQSFTKIGALDTRLNDLKEHDTRKISSLSRKVEHTQGCETKSQERILKLEQSMNEHFNYTKELATIVNTSTAKIHELETIISQDRTKIQELLVHTDTLIKHNGGIVELIRSRIDDVLTKSLPDLLKPLIDSIVLPAVANNISILVGNQRINLSRSRPEHVIIPPAAPAPVPPILPTIPDTHIQTAENLLVLHDSPPPSPPPAPVPHVAPLSASGAADQTACDWIDLNREHTEYISFKSVGNNKIRVIVTPSACELLQSSEAESVLFYLHVTATVQNLIDSLKTEQFVQPSRLIPENYDLQFQVNGNIVHRSVSINFLLTSPFQVKFIAHSPPQPLSPVQQRGEAILAAVAQVAGEDDEEEEKEEDEDEDKPKPRKWTTKDFDRQSLNTFISTPLKKPNHPTDALYRTVGTVCAQCTRDHHKCSKGNKCNYCYDHDYICRDEPGRPKSSRSRDRDEDHQPSQKKPKQQMIQKATEQEQDVGDLDRVISHEIDQGKYVYHCTWKDHSSDHITRENEASFNNAHDAPFLINYWKGKNRSGYVPIEYDDLNEIIKCCKRSKAAGLHTPAYEYVYECTWQYDTSRKSLLGERYILQKNQYKMVREYWTAHPDMQRDRAIPFLD